MESKTQLRHSTNHNGLKLIFDFLYQKVTYVLERKKDFKSIES